MSDFGDRPFVAGSLTGLRSFKVDELGRLRGVRYEAVFKPGENVARCMKNYARGMTMTAGMSYMVSFIPSSEGEELPEQSEHRPGELGCSCGFYAYYDDDNNPHHDGGQALAIVEGYGVCSVGTRGFRAEKARLVALIAQRKDGRLGDGIARRIETAGIGPLVGVPAFMAALGSLPTLIALAVNVSPWFLLLLLLTALFAVLFYLAMRADFGNLSEQPRVDFDLVRRNYPDVPIYKSKNQALRQHPLTPVPPPPPPSPETDPNFWTRGDLT